MPNETFIPQSQHFFTWFTFRHCPISYSSFMLFHFTLLILVVRQLCQPASLLFAQL